MLVTSEYGTVSFDLPAGAVADLAGNGNVVSSTATVLFTPVQTLSLSPAAGDGSEASASSFAVTATLSVKAVGSSRSRSA